MFKGFTYFIKFAWKRQKSFLILAFLREMFDKIKPLIMIILPKFIIDGITEKKDLKEIIIYILILVFFLLFSNLISGTLMFYSENARNVLHIKTQEHIINQVSNTDYKTIESDSFLNKQKMAEAYMFSGGIFAGIYSTGLTILGNLVNFIGIIAIISTLNIWVVVVLIILVLFNSFVQSRFSVKFYEIGKTMQLANRRGDYIERLLTSREYGKELRINKIKTTILKKYKHYNKILFKESKTERKYGLIMRIVRGITSFFQEIIVYIYLTIQALNGAIGIGSFTMYLNAVSQFSWAMMDTMQSIIDIKRIDLNYKDFDEYMDLPQNMRKGENLSVANPQEQHSIEFIDVWFKYPNSEKYILENINIEIEAGEKLSIVGENGAGKTTFIKLLTRLYDPTKGKVLFDGINIKDLNYDEYMKALSVVFQDFKLFAFSIKENITLKDNEEVTDEEVLKIIEKAGLSEKIKKLKNGIHTTVYKEFDDNGVELSGGEGQKIAIARALYKNGGIVVLDEPTAALDSRSEYDIYMKFNELIKGKTAIFISHRLSSSRFCDKVAVFEMGKIKEYGTHDSLIEKDGLYAELYKKQAQFYIDVDI